MNRFSILENNLEIGFDKLVINGRAFHEGDSELFPLQIDVMDESVGCLRFQSDFGCSTVGDCQHSGWSYAGGPGFVVKIEETSTTALDKPRTFQCNLPEVILKKNQKGEFFKFFNLFFIRVHHLPCRNVQRQVQLAK